MLKKRIVIPLMAFAVGLAIVLVETSTACTIGVASGRATANGRPMIWKSSDLNWMMASRRFLNSGLKAFSTTFIESVE